MPLGEAKPRSGIMLPNFRAGRWSRIPAGCLDEKVPDVVGRWRWNWILVLDSHLKSKRRFKAHLQKRGKAVTCSEIGVACAHWKRALDSAR